MSKGTAESTWILYMCNYLKVNKKRVIRQKTMFSGKVET